MLWLLLLLEEVDGQWMYDGCVCGFRTLGGIMRTLCVMPHAYE